jgi:uncharacterized membrane protein (DUF2068 family)
VEEPARDGGRTWLTLIGLFKLLKGASLIAVGVGALSLLHRDVAQVLAHWIAAFQLDPHRLLIHRLLERATHLDERTLAELGVGTFFYAALFLTEGIGLLFRRRWAEYLTAFATASLIPLEAYELVRRFTVPRLVVITINVAVVVYLVARLAQRPRRQLD